MLEILLKAAAKGNLAAIIAVLDADPSLLESAGPHPYWGGQVTALHLAAEWGRVDVIQWLLARGASPNPDSTAYDGWTPLQTAIHRNDTAAVDTLLSGGAKLTIWSAAALGRLDAVRALAAEGTGFGPNAATPLHFAATLPVAAFLLANGARLDARDKYNRTPAEALAAYGSRFRDAGLYLTNLAGDMDLPRAVAFGQLDDAMRLFDPAINVLPAAALHGHTAIVEFLLANGADPNDGFPLHQAARNGHIETARLLLDHGSNPALPDGWHHSTPLDWARFHEQLEMAAFLEARLR